MFKRTVATVLVLVMLLGLLPILPASTTAFAASSGSCGKNMTWTLYADGTLAIYGYGEMDNYNIDYSAPPPWYDQRASIKKITFSGTGSGITSIGGQAFINCSNLTTVVPPSTLKAVGYSAFFKCVSLKDFSLPESVTTIGSGAFYECKSLTKVPSDSNLMYVTSLGMGAFEYCEKIQNAAFPPSLTEIPAFLYYHCESIKKVVIPESVTRVGEYAFCDCTALEEVVLNSGVTELTEKSFMNCYALKKVFVSNALTMGELALGNCPSSVEVNIAITETAFKNNSVIDSSNTTFSRMNLKYSEKYALVMHPCGGKGGIYGTLGEPYVYVKQRGVSHTISKDSSVIPTRAGYEFIGWNTKPDGSGTAFKQGDIYTGNATLNLYAQWKSNITRLAGSSRNGTAVAISKEVEIDRDGCSAVVLANGWDFADALVGGPLAYALDAPILLITGDDSDAETYAEIKRLGVDKVFILGGTVAVGKDVENKLKKDGYTVRRIAGENRFETAVKIAEEIDVLWDCYSNTAIFAYSHNYPDALAVSGAAAIEGMPILYIDSNGLLDPATEAYVNKCRFKNVYILGGMYAISLVAEDSITRAGAQSTDRIAGVTRYETCIDINRKFASSFKTLSMCFSTGVNFPDALAGGVLAASKACPLLLVAPDEPLSEAQDKYIRGYFNGLRGEGFILGGKVAVPEAVEKELEGIIPRVNAY